MAKKENRNENKVKKHFFKDFKAELKKVIWPTPKQLVNNTVAVVVIVLITAAIVFVLDLVFMGMNEYGVNKLKTHIQSKEQSQSQDVNNTVNNEQTDSNNENASSNENSQEANNQNTENNNTAE